MSDSTLDSVRAIVEGRFPPAEAAPPRANLFTLLGDTYALDVRESVTRLCPDSLCPRAKDGPAVRLRWLLEDLAAVYLHRVIPPAWADRLPDVTNNWGGFFRGGQLAGSPTWMQQARRETARDRPALLREFFRRAARPGQEPRLHFLHLLFPHEPIAYLPDGTNYGQTWLRGTPEGRWDDHPWAIASAQQRHTLQAQLADRLLGELLDALESSGRLEDSLLLVTADHGMSFLAGDTRRALSERNAQSVLRVPLFLRTPGQKQGRRDPRPAMTVDILPTVLDHLGLDPALLELDGVSLAAEAPPGPRPRRANSFADRRLRVVEEEQLELRGIVAQARFRLGLDGPEPLWSIGPFDDRRGEPLESLCVPEPTRIRYRLEALEPLPGTDPADFVPAYVLGRVAGREPPEESLSFVVSSGGEVVASGFTWRFHGAWQFFALVEPRWSARTDWRPEVYLVDGERCLAPRAP